MALKALYFQQWLESTTFNFFCVKTQALSTRGQPDACQPAPPHLVQVLQYELGALVAAVAVEDADVVAERPEIDGRGGVAILVSRLAPIRRVGAHEETVRQWIAQVTGSRSSRASKTRLVGLRIVTLYTRRLVGISYCYYYPWETSFCKRGCV